jgi:hypothetical protein
LERELGWRSNAIRRLINRIPGQGPESMRVTFEFRQTEISQERGALKSLIIIILRARPYRTLRRFLLRKTNNPSSKNKSTVQLRDSLSFVHTDSETKTVFL